MRIVVYIVCSMLRKRLMNFENMVSQRVDTYVHAFTIEQDIKYY